MSNRPHASRSSFRTAALLPLLLATCHLAACEAEASGPVTPEPPGGHEPPAEALVQTDRGLVQGVVDGPITHFFGIPYAAPPTGDRRFRAPVPPEPWAQPLNASRFGASCPQGADLLGESTAWDEDCLSINVWAPTGKPAGSLPVMVFIHGGAFRAGSNSKALYEARELARAGQVVVASMNYRLGTLGLMAHPALSAEDEHGSSGNYALLDQQAALRWVQSNIAAFGGDPDKVTLFGESAGSMSICIHLVSPLSTGLFQRAIGESGSCLKFGRPLRGTAGSTGQSAEARGEAVANSLGCAGAEDVLGCLRSVPAADLLDLAADSGGAVELGSAMPQPNIDGYLLSEPPAVSFAAGRINPIQGFIGGTNTDEATLFTRAKSIETVADYEAAIRNLVPAHVAEVMSMYAPGDPAYRTVKDAYDAFVTDFFFLCPTRAQLSALSQHGVPTYLYRFEMLTRFGRLSRLGVHHGSELPFVFGNLAEDSRPEERTLSAAMMKYWTQFAAVGNPNAEAAVTWPTRSASADLSLILAEPIRAEAAPRAAACDTLLGWSAAP